MSSTPELVKPERRSFLKFLTMGGGVLVMGGVLSRMSAFQSGKSLSAKDKLFSNFRIAENKKEIIFSDNKGGEVLIIEKDT